MRSGVARELGMARFGRSVGFVQPDGSIAFSSFMSNLRSKSRSATARTERLVSRSSLFRASFRSDDAICVVA